MQDSVENYYDKTLVIPKTGTHLIFTNTFKIKSQGTLLETKKSVCVFTMQAFFFFFHTSNSKRTTLLI